MHNRIKLHAFFFGKNNERKGKSMIVQLIENIAASSRYRFYDQNKIFTNPSVPGYGQSINIKQ